MNLPFFELCYVTLDSITPNNRYGDLLQNVNDEEGHQHASERKTRQAAENAENERLRMEQQKAASEKKKVLGLMIEPNCRRVSR
jgi:hypothetical protein